MEAEDHARAVLVELFHAFFREQGLEVSDRFEYIQHDVERVFDDWVNIDGLAGDVNVVLDHIEGGLGRRVALGLDRASVLLDTASLRPQKQSSLEPTHELRIVVKDVLYRHFWLRLCNTKQHRTTQHHHEAHQQGARHNTLSSH